MTFKVPRFANSQIVEMKDDELFREIKNFRKLIQRMRREKVSTKCAEEEAAYLLAEAQNRGHKI